MDMALEMLLSVSGLNAQMDISLEMLPVSGQNAEMDMFLEMLKMIWTEGRYDQSY
jgi:hypothetical protein